MSERQKFREQLMKLALPVLDSASADEIFIKMPMRQGSEDRSKFSHLEAIARLLSGIAPFLEGGLKEDRDINQREIVDKARIAVSNITSRKSNSFLNFSEGNQPLVDTAFLAQAFSRAPNALWGGISDEVKCNVINCLESSRKIRPHFNNWLLFSAMIEAFLCSIGEPWDRMRVDYALRQHQQWYVGDGTYGDGAEFHWDYYNSFVILPMLLDILDAVQGQHSEWDRMRPLVLLRAQRHAEVLERMIGPDGSYPLIGRSLAYRCGFLHVLAQLAWQQRLPASLDPGAVRAAMWAVIEKTLGRAENYDENGWLQIGINGHQPGVGENYISTGSLYLCSVAFLPLGLEESAPFWSLPEKPWTQRACFWLGQDMTLDKALK
ncbi:DUF2264 domain-containing protein [Comamonas thiooxydans]|uniref:DUF2264 domain-containing protein n=1 Tax=Comamonas thiooxydans TaxID=363952 RepID=UPI00054F62B8|nr:DUF2264 domain-containing protein [Comamonas thiooxydans]